MSFDGNSAMDWVMDILTGFTFFFPPSSNKDQAPASPTSSSPRYSFGALNNTTTSELPVPVLYGSLKCYGNNIYQSEPADPITRVVSICEGEIESITNVLVNDVPIEDITGCSYVLILEHQIKQ